MYIICKVSHMSHRCGFARQQRVLKTFPDPTYLHSGDGFSDFGTTTLRNQYHFTKNV